MYSKSFEPGNSAKIAPYGVTRVADQNLKGEFLVSMPALKGDYFQASVTFLIDHNTDGAFGLVINNPTDMQLQDIFPELEGTTQQVDLLEGGPVEQDRIFFLHTSDKHYEHSLVVNPETTLSTSPELISDLATQDSPEHLLAIIGYAGWGAGQLEAELLADAWLITPFDRNILFSRDHETKPQAAASKMGIDLNLIGPTSGHG